MTIHFSTMLGAIIAVGPPVMPPQSCPINTAFSLPDGYINSVYL
jgi:hypothetical protein